MHSVETMRNFIVRFLYAAIWSGIIFVALKYGMPLFMPFVIAFLLACLLNPLVKKVAGKAPRGRRLAAGLALVLVYAVFGTLIAVLGMRLVLLLGRWLADLPKLYTQYIEPAAANVTHRLDDFIIALDPSVTAFFEMAIQSISSSASNLIGAISSWAINFLTGAASGVPWFVASMVLCIIASFFFLIDYGQITGFIARQFSRRAMRRLFLIRDFVVNVLLRFARAYLILITLTFVEVCIGLLILRVPNPFVIAFFTAVVDVLPVFGTGTIMIPWALYALFSGNYFLGVGLLVLYAVITVIRQFLEPRIVGAQIGLYPLLTLISMFVGARLFGIWGLFGLPVVLTVLIHLNRIGEIRLFIEPGQTGGDKPENASGAGTGAAPGEAGRGGGGDGGTD